LLGIKGSIAAASERGLSLMLPGSIEGPQASPQLLRRQDGGREQLPVGLDAWEVPALGIEPGAVVDLLLALPPACPPGVAIGDSLRFLAEVSKLGLEFVARGRLLPELAHWGDEWVARWRPIAVDPEDAQRIGLLVDALPPLVRAECSVTREGESPAAIVESLLAAVVDSCARGFVAETLTGGVGRASTVVDAWLTALAGPDAVVRGEERELAELAEALERWREAGLQDAAQRSFRTCFRLSAPDAGDDECEQPDAAGGWRVEILVQAKDDPSVLVGAQDVWSANGSGLTVLGQRLANPQERLLGGLGHALRLWPELEPALRDTAPTQVDLSRDAAFRFLREAAPALEQAGFGVLAPAWWGARVRPKLHVSTDGEWEEGRGLLGIDGLCAYEWRVAVGDVTLTLSELREMAALKLP
jgi:non-specific serine/threonine protein kinase